MKRYTLCLLFDSELSSTLVLERNKQPYKGMINGLGGKIEDGESKEEALFRELSEEAGLSSDDIRKCVYLTTMLFPSNVELNVFYAVLTDECVSRLRPQTPEMDEGELKWMDVYSLLRADNEHLAGEGNISYFVQYARILEGAFDYSADGSHLVS